MYENDVGKYIVDGLITGIEKEDSVLAKRLTEHCIACGASIPNGSQVCTQCLLKENYDGNF